MPSMSILDTLGGHTAIAVGDTIIAANDWNS
eukprot:CAMPEP_0115875792 /NCGR_PEP_ID=MMETSP0287-20121206/25297_1 /TAXON_ID=412157 /ORGANISM="Chrysochromulina rotalis, Strain UIO044" /LENGTH=30 /DNA_ID= /DNA_START= /DNA_END= /DNA_ORIENTATION=